MPPASNVCHLCGLPLPGNPTAVHTNDGMLLRFCCDSCRQIHHMLHPGTPSGGRGMDPTHRSDLEFS